MILFRDILLKNGSAVDATIAAMFCNGFVNIQSMGIGGGFLMTVYKRDTKTAYTLNAREVAPAKASENMYKDNKEAATKGDSINVLFSNAKRSYQVYK
jgi:gamma-glutamyltranspeptidase / glutathione hydrolase / leukotriene-C4 hydrolase